MGNGRRDLSGGKRGRVGGVGGEVETFLLNAVLDGLGGRDLLPELLEVRGAHSYGTGRKPPPSAGRRNSTHWHPCTRLAWDPMGSLPAWLVQLGSPKLRQPSADHAPGNHHPKLGTALCASSRGGEAARPHREPQNKLPAAPGEPHRAASGGEETPAPHTLAPLCKRQSGAQSCTQPSSNSPKLLRLLMQSGSKLQMGALGKATLPAHFPAPFPALPCCREKLQPRGPPDPGRGPYLGAGSAGARCPAPVGGSPAPGAAGLTGAAAGAAASAGAAAGRPAACSLTAARRQKGEIKACYFQPCSRNLAGEAGAQRRQQRGMSAAVVPWPCVPPSCCWAAGPAQLAAEPDGGFDLSEEEGKKRKGEGKNKALKREGASRAGGLHGAETQLLPARWVNPQT